MGLYKGYIGGYTRDILGVIQGIYWDYIGIMSTPAITGSSASTFHEACFCRLTKRPEFLGGMGASLTRENPV